MITVLIVDDQPMMVELFRRLLVDVAGDIRSAENIYDALEEMRKLPSPDLVLLDIKLKPKFGVPQYTGEGNETLEQIRSMKEINPDAVILVITGMHDTSLPGLAIQLGADGFRHKMHVNTQAALFDAIAQSISEHRIEEGRPSYAKLMQLLKVMNGLLTLGDGHA